MTSYTDLTEEQKKEIRKLEFYYKDAVKFSVNSNKDDLFSRVITLDNTLKKHALARAICNGIFGFLLLITGYNFLTLLAHAFLPGIIFFCLGAIALALSYPLYNMLLNKSRKKYAPVVLAITSFLS